MKQAIDGYALTQSLYLDDMFVFARAVRTSDCTPALLRIARMHGPAQRAALEHEYGLRAALDPAWAVVPRAFHDGGPHAALEFDDPGNILQPLDLGIARPLAESLRIAEAIAAALAHMHTCKIAHQRLAACHILHGLSDDGGAEQIRLTGFGAARRMPAGPDVDPDGSLMAPALIEPDLFGFGLLLTHMLAACPPADGAILEAGRAIAYKLCEAGAHGYRSAACVKADLQQCRALLEGGGEGDPAPAWQGAPAPVGVGGAGIAEALVVRLRQLPPATFDLVRLLACLGVEADLGTLALVSGMSAQETEECLWPAARLGLVLRERAGCRFMHERVRAGAYALIEPASLAQRHLHVGRVLLADAADAIEPHLFGIVHHLNRALAVISKRSELQQVTQLNVRAAAMARHGADYDKARDYYSLAVGLTPPGAWQDNFEPTFALYLALAECEYLGGHFERAARLFMLLTEQVRTRAELTRVTLLRIALYQMAGRFDQAADAALDTLAVFGLAFPDDPAGIGPALAAEQHAIAAALAAHGGALSEALNDAPACTDPDLAAICTLLADMGSSVFSARPELYPLLAARALNFTLRHGLTATSYLACSRYAVLLVSLGAMRDAFALSELAFQLMPGAGDLDGPASRAGRLHFIHGAYIHPWREPVAASVPQLEQAFRYCREAGDLPHAGFAAHVATWNRFEAGMPLADVIDSARNYQAFAHQQRNIPLLQLLRGYEQLALCLQGQTCTEASLDDGQFSVAVALAACEDARFGAGQARLHLIRQIAAHTFGHWDGALAAAQAAAGASQFLLASINQATHQFYHALTLAALYEDAPRARRAGMLREVRAILGRLRTWARGCPHNFDNRYQLVTAELARLRKRPQAAMRAYEQAIASAAAGGFVHHQAMACELAAAHAQQHGADPLQHARQAVACWQAWGAHGKASQLLRRYPALNP